MDYLVDYIMGLPAQAVFTGPITSFLAKHGIVTSSNILANLHSVIYVAEAYHLVFLVSQWILFPPLVRWRLSHDADKSPRRYNDLLNQSVVHFVSLVQSFVILYLSLGYIRDHGTSTHPTPESRIFSESAETNVICVFAIGYFVWDALISLVYSSLPFVVHGVVSALMFTIGLKPYIQYYAPAFLLFELSNPFLNFRWFGIKFMPQLSAENQSTSAAVCNVIQLLNNVMLICIFFGARIAWGWLKIYELAFDFYKVRNDPRFLFTESLVIVSGNFILDVLNVVWFSQMASVAKRIILKRGRVQDKPATEAHC